MLGAQQPSGPIIGELLNVTVNVPIVEVKNHLSSFHYQASELSLHFIFSKYFVTKMLSLVQS